MEPTGGYWLITVTYTDETTQVFTAKDLNEFHWRMVPYIHNAEGKPMKSILIH